jgi:phosphoglycolate phosphatase
VMCAGAMFWAGIGTALSPRSSSPMNPETPPSPAAQLDWSTIDLVVFDVDGTLYDQRQLRLGMLRQLLGHAWQTRSLDTLLTLRTFRHVREALGELGEDQAGADFMALQYAQTASRHGTTPAAVRALTEEWMEQRPLPLLAACRYPHVAEVFAGLRAAGKQIAAFSDYPAVAKLAALGLQADVVVCATDADIARLKPDPAGMLAILRQTGVAPSRALMIGDRFDRDAVVAERAGMRALIRSPQAHARWATFRGYDDAVFRPLLAGLGAVRGA